MIRKFATLAVIDAQMWDDTRRTAHRAVFQYVPRKGFLYVRSRAISSRTNDNFDHFPGEEIKEAYRSFVGKPVFVNHHNSDHRRARGVIIDAALHEDRLADGQEDTWVEVLMEIDAVRFPKLARAILAGEVERTSMGCDVAYSICSVCNNRASTPLEYCKHIPAMKGQKIRRVTASGGQEDILVYEKCYGLKFFENSVLVEDPADPTAFFLDVDDRGVGGGYQGSLAKAASNYAAIERQAKLAWIKSDPDDPHSLANLNPADYEWVQEFDYGFEDQILKSIGAIWQALAEAGQNPTAALFAGEYDEIERWKAQLAQIERNCIAGRPFRENGRCDHCGTNARYFSVFRYKPTGEWLCVGHTCAENRLGLQTREDLDKARHQWVLKGLETKRENAEKDRKFNADPRRVKVRDFLLNYRSLVEKGEYRQVGFYEDLLRSLKQYHDLTEGQLSAVERGMEKFTDEVEEYQLRRRQELADEASAQPCPSGTETITGKVLSTKWQNSQYGSTLKMLVRDDRGFKVWGTVPNDLSGVERMDRVTFVCTVEPSDDDRYFGFFRRPRKAEVLPRTASSHSLGAWSSDAPSAEPIDRTLSSGAASRRATDSSGGASHAVARPTETGDSTASRSAERRTSSASSASPRPTGNGSSPSRVASAPSAVSPRPGSSRGDSTDSPSTMTMTPGRFVDSSAPSATPRWASSTTTPTSSEPPSATWSDLGSERPRKAEFLPKTAMASVEMTAEVAYDRGWQAAKRPTKSGGRDFDDIYERFASKYGDRWYAAFDEGYFDYVNNQAHRYKGTPGIDGGTERTALTKQAASTTYTLVQSSELGHHTFELHIAGCGDLSQPKYSSATRMDIQADSIDEAIDLSVDFDLGYTLDDLKVFSCARSGVAPEPRALNPDLCPGSGMPLDNPQRRLQVPCPVCGKSVKAADQRTGRTRKDIPKHKPATTAALRSPQGVRMTASKLAYGETVAPRQVSTLRDDSCPVCGEVSGFNGERCMTCGYFKPPDEFMDPDLTKAKEVDLRQNQEETAEIDAEGDTDDVFDLDNPGDPGAEDDADVEQDPNAPVVDGEVTSGPTTPAEEGAQKAVDGEEPPVDLKGHESPPPDPTPGRITQDDESPELKGTVFELAKPEEEVQEPAQPDPAPAKPEADEGGDDPASEDDDDQDDDESSPPKKPKKQSTRRNRGESMRPTLKALAEQQIMLDANKKAIQTIAQLAGVDVSGIYAVADRRIASMQRRADAENPAQPIPEPSAEAPSESSDEALGNLNDADVTSVGTVTTEDGLSGTTVDVTAVGEVMADEAAATADVTAPTSGAAMEDQDATLQGDVTARGLDAETAFPIESGFSAAAAQQRVFASLRLARLRIQAGIAQGDDLQLGEHIAKSAMTDGEIRHEIGTLSAVARTASTTSRQPAPFTRETRRAVPSLGAAASHAAAPSNGTGAPVSDPGIEDAFLFG